MRAPAVLKVSAQLPVATLAEQVSPVLAVSATVPVGVVSDGLVATAKLKLTLAPSADGFTELPVIVVVVALAVIA